MTFWEEQMVHEPTRLYYEKLREIVKGHIALGQTFINDQIVSGSYDVLEIGLDVGISARCFLEFPVISLTSVDCGDVERGIKEIETMDTGRWTFHHMRSDEYFSQCKNQFDIIYIDGDHSYEQTKRDVDNAWKFLKAGGLLIGHDFLHKGNFYTNKDYGVTHAFREFIVGKNVESHIYPPDPGLIVIRK